MMHPALPLGRDRSLLRTPGTGIMAMMLADGLSKASSPEGFRPFVLNLSNGESCRITHPEQVLVDRSVAVIGTKQLNGDRRYEKRVICTLMHIVSLVSIEETEVK